MAYAQLTFTNVTANAERDFLRDGDQGEQRLRFVQRPSRVTYAIAATALELELRVFSGEREVVSRSRVESGATLGVFPNLDQKANSFYAAAGEQLQFLVRETAGAGTVDANLTISVDPIA